MEIGAKIKAARLAKNMTQEELGNLIGVQKSAIAKYESGRVVNIKRSTLKKISDILGIRPSELIFEEVQKKNDTLSDIVVKLRTADDDLLYVVDSICRLDAEKLTAVKTMVSALLK
jgi:transcriptional regulator with XRE-family HTH domain